MNSVIELEGRVEAVEGVNDEQNGIIANLQAADEDIEERLDALESGAGNNSTSSGNRFHSLQ